MVVLLQSQAPLKTKEVLAECLHSQNVHQCVELSWGTMLLMKKAGHSKDMFKHYCPIIPNAIRIYFPLHLNGSLGAKHTQIMPARKQKSNNSGRATAELDLLSRLFHQFNKDLLPCFILDPWGLCTYKTTSISH